MLRGVTVGALFLALAACGRELPRTNLAGLAAEARMIVSNASDEFPIITSLKARRIDRREDGVYIVMGELFVEEWGFFVPRDPSFTTPEAGDPTFTPLGEGVWRFDVAG